MLLSVPLTASVSAGVCVNVSAAKTVNSKVVFFSGGEQTSEKDYSTPEQAWKAAAGHTGSDKKAAITLGSDWVSSQMQELTNGQHITLDLNGHCIRRDLDGKQKSNLSLG